MSGTIELSNETPTKTDDGLMAESLPKEAGVFLILIGIGGVLIPGPIGAPFLILGGLVFFPKTFRKFDDFLQKRFPKSHRQGMKQVRRFVDDIDRRYPTHV